MTVLRLFTQPERGWAELAGKSGSWPGTIALLLALAALPAVAWYYGVTQVGWSLGRSAALRITPESAGVIIVLFYLAMVGGILAIAASVQWMSVTYGAKPRLLDAVRLATYTGMPLFIAGLTGFIPVLWIDLVIGVLAAAHALTLLYTGIPVVMHIPKERGYLFSSAVVAMCLVLLIALMGITVTLWEWGAMPVFTD
jgi:hypothetical protein